MKGKELIVSFLLFLFVNTLVHFPFLSKAPAGTHVWRQCNTLAMSRNFARESMDIFHPRIDRRNETNGITGSHFPLYEWGLACIWKMSGINETVARIYSLLISTFAMLALCLLFYQRNTDLSMARAGSVLFLSIPQLYYDSINAMPDIAALSLALFALYFCRRFFASDSIIFALCALVFTLLSGLIKFQFLIIPFASIVYIQNKRSQWIYTILGAAIVCTSVFLWYKYALALTEINNLREYGLWIKPIGNSEVLKTVLTNITSDVPELLSGWPFLVFFIFLLFKVKWKSLGQSDLLFYGIWGVTFIVFYVIAIERMLHHSYYFLSVIPLFALLCMHLITASKIRKSIVFVMISLNMVWAIVRIVPSRWIDSKSGVPEPFLSRSFRERIHKTIPDGKLVICGPDLSGCIFFYFMDMKGFSFDNPEELSEKRDSEYLIHTMYKKGAEYLVIKHETKSNILLEKIKNKQLLFSENGFSVWKLGENPIY